MQLTIRTTQKDEIVDITDDVEDFLNKAPIREGICSIFATHTTCALTTADLDPGTDKDLLDALRHLLPQLSYRHPHNPSHAPDHILSSLLGPSLTIPIQHSQLALGIWQRIILVELDGPRERNLLVTFLRSR